MNTPSDSALAQAFREIKARRLPSYFTAVDCVDAVEDRAAEIEASRGGADECSACNGRGLVGGFVNADSGYQDDPCPDCAPQPAAARHGVKHATIRATDEDDVLHVECRFDDGQKYAAVEVSGHRAEELADTILSALTEVPAAAGELPEACACGCGFSKLCVEAMELAGEINRCAGNNNPETHKGWAKRVTSIAAKIHANAAVAECRRDCAVLRNAVMAVVSECRAYLPPNGITKDEFIARVVQATDNPKINKVIS